ncbi:hypothetical protein BCR42DRAFT_326118 [Absidia repens]|uniref:Uncharacterized protein n=1 Tax=Absidia repens TaxID=90262 RepID=A0A1X2IIT4_9FUNG|nr:hypothetical protein BCR42DRAFT_326118 [Absidia repens]
MVASILIVIDHDPTNVLARSFMFEFSWHFGYAACALYLLGIAQTLSESHKNLTRGWLPSPATVDIIGISFMLGPVVLHNICSIAAGALAYSNLKVAEVFTNLLYGFWFMHCVALSLTVLFAGVRLIRILNGHLSRFPPSGDRYKSIRLGIFKIQALMTIIALCLAGYSVFLLIYAILRDRVTQDSTGSVAMAVIWNFWAPVATLLGEIALLVDPKLGEQSNFGIKTSSGGRVTGSNLMQSTMLSTTITQQHRNTADCTGIVIPPSSTNAPTLSLGAFDPFKKENGAEGGPLTKPMFATEVDHSGMISMNPTGIPMDDVSYFQRQPLQSGFSATSPSESDNETIVNQQSSKSHLVQYGS